MLAFIEVEFQNPSVLSKLRNYLQKWRPMRIALPLNELDALGVPRGPKFDKIIEQLFEMQLRGRARDPEDRAKALRQLAGIRDELKKKTEKEKEKKKKPEKETTSSVAAPSGTAPLPSKQSQKGGGSHSAAAAIGAKAEAKHAALHPTQKQKPAAKLKAQPAKKASRR
jgi:hypothetical protein